MIQKAVGLIFSRFFCDLDEIRNSKCDTSGDLECDTNENSPTPTPTPTHPHVFVLSELTSFRNLEEDCPNLDKNNRQKNQDSGQLKINQSLKKIGYRKYRTRYRENG